MRPAGIVLSASLLAAAVVSAPGAHALPGYIACPPSESLQLDIAGDITCPAAETVADDYDRSGDKYQDVHGFTCYGAAYDVYPIVYTCVRGTDEIVVSDV